MKTFLYTILILLNCFWPVNAQDNSESLQPERIYLQTDRNICIAGGNLFFAIYLKGTPGQTSKYAYLVLRDRYNVPVTQFRVEISNQTAFGNILLPDTLHSDTYQVVCFTNQMRNDGEDSYFTKEIIIVNRFDRKLELFDSTDYTDKSIISLDNIAINKTGKENLVINPDKQIYNSGEKVTFSIETRKIPADSISSLSISVSEIVPGILREPSITDFFASINKTIITGGPGQNRYYYLPEVKGSVIEGKVISMPQSGNQQVKAINDIEKETKTFTILVSTPDSIANLQFATTDTSGSFRFLLNPYYEGKELIIRLKENKGSVIELDNKFKMIKPYIPSGLLNVPGIRSYLIRTLDILEIQRYYTEKTEIITEKKIEHSAAIPRVYYRPYLKVIPADYLPLTDFTEISRELLPGLKVRKNNDNYTFSYINTQNKGTPNMVPVIFLDGVPIDDVDQIINLGTSQITRIDLLPVIRYYGEMPFYGILAIFSKNMEINNIRFKTPALRYQAVSSQSYTKPQKYVPVNDKHIPDLRQVLLWDPGIILRFNEKKQIEFFTSDLRGNYLIRIQGMTSSGIPVSGSAVIEVKVKK